ncbi:hypothetical protein V8U06_19545 [Shinella sp. G-2]
MAEPFSARLSSALKPWRANVLHRVRGWHSLRQLARQMLQLLHKPDMPPRSLRRAADQTDDVIASEHREAEKQLKGLGEADLIPGANGQLRAKLAPRFYFLLYNIKGTIKRECTPC